MYRFPLIVEFEDIDIYQIAHHTKIIAYLERCRAHYFHDNNYLLNQNKYGIVLRDLNVRFRNPLFFMDEVEIVMSVKSLEKLRLIWDYKILKQGKTCATANIEQVVIDLKQKKIVPIPDEIKNLLGKLLN